MAMIGRNAAIFEIGRRRRELHGVRRLRGVARRARLAAQRLPRAGDRAVGVGMGLLHANRAPSIIGPDTARIDWDDPATDAGDLVVDDCALDRVDDD